jgi:RimJ/RimL family protein N-acetyltransferase
MELELRKGIKVDVTSLTEVSDANAITKFVNDVHAESEHLAKIHPIKEGKETEWLKNKKDEISKGATVYIIALDKDKIIGSASLTCFKGRMSHVAEFEVMVREEHRGEGLGSALAEEVLKHRTPQMERVMLYYFSGNKIARRIYDRLGFREVAKMKGWFKADNGTYEDMINMELLS